MSVFGGLGSLAASAASDVVAGAAGSLLGSAFGGSMNGDHLAQAGGTFEPQRQNNFTLIIGGLRPDRMQKIQLGLEASALPSVSVEEITLDYMNVKRYVAGKVTYDTIPLVVKDMVDVGTASAMKEWFATVYDPTSDKVGLARNYKKYASMVLFATDGSYKRVWNLQGIWPMAMNFGALDYASGEKVLIEATLRFDKAIGIF